MGSLHRKDMNLQAPAAYNSLAAYGQSKLAQVRVGRVRQCGVWGGMGAQGRQAGWLAVCHSKVICCAWTALQRGCECLAWQNR